MSTKENRHAKMDAFKNEIVSVANRNRLIKELTRNAKNGINDIDELKIVILLQKASLITGCTINYQSLLDAIKVYGNEKLKSQAQTFAKKTGLSFSIEEIRVEF